MADVAQIKWEYWVTHPPGRAAVHDIDFEVWLDEHGAEGWELVSMESRDATADGFGRLIFKRVAATQ